MDAKGFAEISKVMQDIELDAEITPQVLEGEDVRYVTIETNPNIQPSLVLNALLAARLMEATGTQEAVINYGPELRVLGVSPGSLTFEDINGGRARR